jgi:hypothetical protein
LAGLSIIGAALVVSQVNLRSPPTLLGITGGKP